MAVRALSIYIMRKMAGEPENRPRIMNAHTRKSANVLSFVSIDHVYPENKYQKRHFNYCFHNWFL